MKLTAAVSLSKPFSSILNFRARRRILSRSLPMSSFSNSFTFKMVVFTE